MTCCFLFLSSAACNGKGKGLAAAAAIKALTNAGANAALAAKGVMPLHLAAQYGTPEAVTALAAAGAPVDAANDSGWRPLHVACERSSRRAAAMVKVLLDVGADPEATDAEGGSALHYAAWRGKAGAVGPVVALIAAGASISRADSNSDTPMHCAALNRGAAAAVEAINALRLAGADHSSPSPGDGRTPLHR